MCCWSLIQTGIAWMVHLGLQGCVERRRHIHLGASAYTPANKRMMHCSSMIKSRNVQLWIYDWTRTEQWSTCIWKFSYLCTVWAKWLFIHLRVVDILALIHDGAKYWESLPLFSHWLKITFDCWLQYAICKYLVHGLVLFQKIHQYLKMLVS